MFGVRDDDTGGGLHVIGGMAGWMAVGMETALASRPAPIRSALQVCDRGVGGWRPSDCLGVGENV